MQDKEEEMTKMESEFVNTNKNITKEVMEQYEVIRTSGVCNMFDYYCVIRTAAMLDYHELAALYVNDYIYLLSNFGSLMKLYGVNQ